VVKNSSDVAEVTKEMLDHDFEEGTFKVVIAYNGFCSYV
jgi:hypothetical protein